MKKILIISGKYKNYERNYLFFDILKKNYSIINYNYEGNFFKKNLNIIKIIFLDYDLIFINWPYWSSFFMVNFINCFKRKPIIYDFFTLIHEDYLDKNFNKKKMFIIDRLYSYLEKFIANKSSALITDTEIHKNVLIRKSKKMNNQILSFEISQKKISFVKSKKRSSILKILHSSANRNMHGADKIIHLIASLPKKIKSKIKLKMILKDYQGKLQLLADKYNLKNNVEIFKRVKKNFFLDSVKNADVCLGIFGNSSKSNNVISNFIVTSCNYSKILITKKTSASNYYFKNNANIILLSQINSRSFLKAIKEILSSKKITNLKKESSKIIFDKKFDIKINSRKLIKFFDQCLN